MRVLRTYEESRFWKALEDCGAGRRPCANAQAVRELKAAVGAVAGRAKEIGKEICRYLPQYTLHDETHLLNVLSIMDALVPDALMARLTPLECGLCLLAAYTHDLGMALSAEEHQALAGEEDTPERRRYQAFRDGYGEELRQVERWLKTGTAEGGRRAELIEGYLLATYLRETHTDADSGRIERWLRAVMADTRNEGLYRYNGFHYLQNLVDIAASHGQSVSWLRQRLAPEGDGAFDRLVGAGERANLAFPGLLLRLADILDFDASRAPGILFRHIGIENERSILEWNKHLAIRGWELVREERPTLSYEAECAHPAYEKAIRDFVRSIDEELRAVADEALRQNDRVFKHRRHFDLDLPARVDLQVFPEGHPHRPAYVYREMQFRLDQDEIRQLLLGQSLWGDPQLCIRELLQNALDAVQMRDLRLKAKAKGEQALGPADPLPAGEELRVELSWGRDKTCDQEYIVVRDNGIGMTREVLERYFTQIGKSYYRSPDYKRERAALNAHGLLATPISFFGIGILSCFMIADRLEVRTHPGGRNPEATDVTISGPGSLFWLKTGTRAHQGTEVKLFLKREYHLVDVPDMLLHRLNMHFYRAPGESGVALAQDPHGVDPAFATGTHVLWPLFPVLVGPEGGQVLRIDGDFHKDVLFPIDRQKVVKKAGEWGCPESWVGDAEWGTWDWTDDVGPEATGSRVRLWFPRARGTAGRLPVDPPAGSPCCRLDELAAFVETQLSEKGRLRVAVHGMSVAHVDICLKEVRVAPAVGGLVWVDLRGDAAPRLSVDRATAMAPEEDALWRDAVAGVFRRMGERLAVEIAEAPPSAVRNLLAGFRWAEVLRPLMPLPTVPALDLLAVSAAPWPGSGAGTAGQWMTMCLMQDASLDRVLDLALDLARDHYLDRALDRARNRHRVLDLARALDLALALDLARALALDLGIHRDGARALDLAGRTACFGAAAWASAGQEAFAPSLQQSLPMLGCCGLRGRIGDASLAGPGLVTFGLESDGRTVHLSDRQGRRPDELVSRGYDIVSPMTAIPLGALRRQCPKWREDRHYRARGVVPFLLPGEAEGWRERSATLVDLFHVERIYALLPDVALWSKPFAEWTEEEWRTCGLSALWDIREGTVLWAEGAHPVEEMHRIGLPLEEFLKR